MGLDITWLACDLATGGIIEELRDLDSGPLGRAIGAVATTQAALPIATAPGPWETLTAPGRTLIVAVWLDHPAHAGIVMARRSGYGPHVRITTATPEVFLGRRYVADHTWTQQDHGSVIAAGLLADTLDEGIGLQIDAPATGVPRDREYRDRDDKTVLRALQELMGLDTPVEFTIDVEWADESQTAVRLVARVRPRIGAALPLGQPPSAVLSTLGDTDAVYELAEDYSEGRGATAVMAVSSGAGDTRPQSAHARAEQLLALGMPRWEHRYTPSTSISDVAVLNEHATRTLPLMALGARTLTLDVRADPAPPRGRTEPPPRFLVDYALGDDVGYEAAGDAHPLTAAGLPTLAGTGRIIGWKLDPGTGRVAPVIVLPGQAAEGV